MSWVSLMWRMHLVKVNSMLMRQTLEMRRTRDRQGRKRRSRGSKKLGLLKKGCWKRIYQGLPMNSRNWFGALLIAVLFGSSTWPSCSHWPTLRKLA
uniref:Uncharacterized protein n=1 Tax=Rhizophora mucronata TaxID=61149 RepID=A0A2P2MJR7_RHIMU